MADITITAANVAQGAGAVVGNGTAGATITAGQPLYIDAADSNKLKLADADASSAASDVVGLALHGASSGQPLKYIKSGAAYVPGATLTQGEVYVLSGNAGGVAPVADLGSGDYPVVLFCANDASTATVKIVRGTGARA